MSRALARTNKALWWVACWVACAVYLVTVPRLWQCEGVDEIEYLGLAHSLVQGDGYTLYGQPYVYYPPFYPVVLSLLMRHGVTAWRWFYAANAVFGLLGVIAAATWLRSRFGRAGFWAGWLAIVSYYAWSFSTRYLLSEPLFFALSVPTLLAAWLILCEDRGRWWHYLVVGAGVLLCAMTRFGAVALTGGICFAALVKWVSTRAKAALILFLLTAFLGGGFVVAWELRASVVAPTAAESYTRWAKKALGVTKEKTGMIAQSVGEGTLVRKNWAERGVELGFRYGQYAASCVRTPSNFMPWALLLWALFLSGLVSHLRRDRCSPVGWYVVFSLLIISLTSWLSSYSRYLYPLTPFVFFFLLAGARAWIRRLLEPSAAGLRMILAAWGLIGLAWTALQWKAPGMFTAETGYVSAAGVACLCAYACLVAAGAAPKIVRRLTTAESSVRLILLALVVICGLQSGFLLAARSRLTARNQTLHERNLAGLVEAGRWLDENSTACSTCLSSLPRLASFLADRRFVRPSYGGDALSLDGVDYVVQTGGLKDVPAFRADEEARLVNSVDPLIRESRLKQVFASGESVVYRVANP